MIGTENTDINLINKDSISDIERNTENMFADSALSKDIRIKSFVAVINDFPESVTTDLILEEFGVEEKDAKLILAYLKNSYKDMKKNGVSVAEMRRWAKSNFCSGKPPFYNRLELPLSKGSKVKKQSQAIRIGLDDITSSILSSPPSSSASSSSSSSLSTSSSSSSSSSSVLPSNLSGGYISRKFKESSLKKRRREPEDYADDEDDDELVIGARENVEDTLLEDEENSSAYESGALIRNANNDVDDGESISSQSENSSEEEDIPQPSFPGMLKKNKMTSAERTVLRNLKKHTSKTIKGSWKDLDVLNQLMDPKVRRKFEVDAQSSRTFYPAPKQFMKPFKGKSMNAFRDTAWYRMQTDINIMYRFVMWSLSQLESNNISIAKRALTSVVVPFIYHLLSRCQRERINVRYPQGVVNALYDDDTEPMIRPGHMRKAKRLAAQQKDLKTISGSFFGQGGRGRGISRRPRGSFFGPQKSRRFSWPGRKNRFPQEQQQQQKQIQRGYQQNKRFPSKESKN
jgi:hypothetical protein